MIQPDAYNTLIMKKQISKGILLTDGEQDILLPASDSRPPFEKGKEISLFVYNNRDSLRATERRPYGLRGDFAALTVKSVETFGVFADWGIPKDLFIPKRNLDHDEYQPGEKIIVRLIPNYDDDTTIGDCYVEDYLEKADGLYTPNQEVEILIYQMTGLGASAIINNRHAGLLYKTFAERAFRIGDRRRAYIKKIRDDGKIDLSLFPQGYRKSVEAAEKTLIEALEAAGGKLPLSDNSSPGEIEAALGMSKALFKRTIGSLYKTGKIKITADAVVLKNAAGKNKNGKTDKGPHRRTGFRN